MFNFAPLSKPILSSEKCTSYSSKGTPTFKDDQTSEQQNQGRNNDEQSHYRKLNITAGRSPIKSLSKRHNFTAVNKSDLKLKETKLMSFCQDDTKNDLNPEVTPCKTSPVLKIETRISRCERSFSPKLKLSHKDVR